MKQIPGACECYLVANHSGFLKEEHVAEHEGQNE